MTENILRNTWLEYMTKIVDEETANAAYDRIESLYKQEFRKYHNLELLEWKVKVFLEYKDHIKEPEAFLLALYFQYTQYTPTNFVNVENAREFQRFASETELAKSNSKVFDAVTKLMNPTSITEAHMDPLLYGSQDRHYFLDMDVLALSLPTPQYNDFVSKLRQEYYFLSDKTYMERRDKVLRNFLQIPNIYSTKAFREKYEQRARENISKELKWIDEHDTY